eukprot:CAMPEP_0114365734 /NCGR_PEP_ID=MMETSP0101-20121206/28645_1 /TAXON_ID=38822 ORGANISM="Pteridomonas danica, Strain PT" /NCGR_SAMPLE_ID=MMETSP0101 /ASSEMBLY_ACC=CAM_ASM_000211 /LENGTH=146 /DNA_ID=CAMNT_0001514237 /DNA_START=106 /DNA_END=543 /DNA_ORIENTATION=+
MVNRLIKPVYDLMQLHCLGYTRQRIRIEALLKDWAAVFTDAQAADATWNAKMSISGGMSYFTEWTMAELSGLMARYIELGFLLELFENEDVPAAYWYWGYLQSVQLHQRAKLRNKMKETCDMQVQMQLESAKETIQKARLEAHASE